MVLRLILPLIAVLLLATPAAAQSRCRAVDGDTLRCGGQRVRVIGLDAPEIHGRCPREIRLARAATERLRQIVAGGVRLESHGRDRYRRRLAVVRDRQGRDVAQLLIRAGLARSYDGHTPRRGWCGRG
ncbi:thermonuclease family protein [Plastoroseomonas hellenica]|uniref:Thermonuclease family protein n=1 Tax=Plastoroseomonas hellenica TaxID=2687306 RepID=A0ABS5F5R3_9PROT|nr:thermonuclease family protein [Plastoroseomonas hellenica]MBR0647604.1 thermonuclease family protein [Plastoroseomonas hellenica]MBR0667876.1 thermonuclease family protein [Plastoroseomonas hellenica]